MNKNGIKTKFPVATLIALAVIGVVIFFFTFNIPSWRQDATNEYQITSYVVNATVRPNNTIKIRETIDVNFDAQSHGIYRYVPTNQKVSFEENGKNYNLRYSTEVTDVNCSHKISTYYENDNFIMQIGSADAYANPTEKYELSYIVHLGDDKISDFDQLYYNFIGTGFDTSVSNVQITINFEKSLPDQQIYFYIGTVSGDEVVEKTILSSSVSFSYDGTLPAFHGITARATLAEGYFTAKKLSNISDIVLLSAAIIVAIGAILIFTFNSNKKKIIPIVEFTPPEGITPADAGYIYNRSVDRGQISSLVVYWASKGYLKIEETDGKTVLKKLKDADENMKEYEKNVFNSLFREDEFDLDEKNIELANAVNNARNEVKVENEKFFSQKVSKFKNLFIFAFSLIFTLNIYFLAQKVAIPAFSILTSLLIGIGIYLAAYLIVYAFERRHSMAKWSMALTLLVGVGVILATYLSTAIFLFEPYANPLFNSITLPILLSPLIILACLFNDRVEGEKHEVGRIFGLRKFIMLTEKDKLKVLVKDSPELYYDILPYAYVLGISGVWIDKFEGIEIPPPSWYVGAPDLLQTYIAIRIFSSMAAFNSVIVRSVPKTTSSGRGGFGGGGSIGGGHSGGGFGGGGGGRW